jgi:hypothetical protein
VRWVPAALFFVSRSFVADDTIARIDAYITSQMQLHHIPALSLIVLRDVKVLRTHAYGIINTSK